MGTTPEKGHGADGFRRHARRHQTLQRLGAVALLVVCALLGLSASAGAATTAGGVSADPVNVAAITGQVQHAVGSVSSDAGAGAVADGAGLTAAITRTVAAATGEAGAAAPISSDAGRSSAAPVDSTGFGSVVSVPAVSVPAPAPAPVSVQVSRITLPGVAPVAPDPAVVPSPRGVGTGVRITPDSAVPGRRAGRPGHATTSGRSVRGQPRAGEQGRRGPSHPPAAGRSSLSGESPAVTAAGWPSASVLGGGTGSVSGSAQSRARLVRRRTLVGRPRHHRLVQAAPAPAPVAPVAPAPSSPPTAASASAIAAGAGGGAAAVLVVVILILAGRSWARISLTDPIWCGCELVPRLERPG